MGFKQLASGCVILGLIMATAPAAYSQGAVRAGDFELKDIRQQQVDAPNYGGAGELGGRPATLWQKWLKIEAQFESKPEWADDVQVKYYVLIGKGDDRRLLVGDLTHINVHKGTQHYSAMFVQPNTLHRYGAGQIDQVTVRLFYKGAVMSTLSAPPNAKEGWWDRFSPTPGYLLPPQDTPWAPIADQRFEAAKPKS